MEFELKKLYDSVIAIHEEMFYLREREEQMQQLNKETNSKMATLGLFSLLLCLCVVGLQALMEASATGVMVEARMQLMGDPRESMDPDPITKRSISTIVWFGF
ncbi:hypothetical protein V6N12_044967 [Hibiscus sabdariffa]|uniref:GOLD domain-containing protein n=1 Tax=Hibiscus sabdariffa TaxID=183260 RepID=A0ABR2G1E3_9ROSI